MTGRYDIALYMPANVTLGRVYEIMERLDVLNIDVNYEELSFEDNGLSFTASYGDIDNIEQIIGLIGDVKIDWDSMSDWEEEE